jgi:iron complex transport system substrate-binding protein
MVRTVSMLPAATEIVGALGLLDQLVAVSHECDFPDGVNTKPRVTRCEIYGKGLPSDAIDRWVSEQLQTAGTLYTLDERLLRELAPDLILTQRLCDVCAPAYGSVQAMAATLPTRPRVLSLEPRSLADVLGNVREVAAAMGHPGHADAVCAALERRVSDIVRRVGGLPRPTVFVMEWADPIFNAGHWTPELVRLAGGTPVLAAEGTDSVRVAWDDLRAADPEVLVIACCGHGIERTRQDVPRLERLPGWRELRAVRDRRVYLSDGSAYFSRPGPRVVDTLEILAALLHPEATDALPPGRAVPAY